MGDMNVGPEGHGLVGEWADMRVPSEFFTVLAVVVASQLVTRPTAAVTNPEPASLTGRYSQYEREAITAAERLLGTVVDPAPEGKWIEVVDIVALEPIEGRDPLPSSLNAVHMTTRRHVVARELLLHEGQNYRKVLADESARNLRALPQLSLVLCIAFQGRTERTVRLVVITKDVWSLYVDFDVGAFNTSSGYLLLEPKETNLAGTHQSILGRFRLDPQTYTLGSAYRIPRLFGSKLSVVLDANTIVNRDSGQSEGSYGTIEVVRPLRTTWDKWSWFSAANWRQDINRTFDTTGNVAVEPNGALTEWRRSEGLVQFALTRSFGWATKHDFTISPSLAQRRYARVRDDLSKSDSQPNDEERVGLGFEWHTYSSSFLRTFDLETLGLQEDYRLGHDVLLGVQPAAGTLIGVHRTFVGLSAAVQQTVPLGNGFVRLAAKWQADTQFSSTSDASVTLSSYVATPQVGIGRLIQSNWFSDHYKNARNIKDSIGGTGRLRGFDTSLGPRVIASNIEYRTPGLSIAELQFGAAAFYDMGAAFDAFRAMALEHSCGFGLRMVVPQIERPVFRLDFGFPIRPRTEVPSPMSVYFTFGQAFDSQPIRGIAPPIAPLTN
jgi:hypothetical protein